MEKVTKALQDLAKAVENNPTVNKIEVKIVLKKPKSSKAQKNDN